MSYRKCNQITGNRNTSRLEQYLNHGITALAHFPTCAVHFCIWLCFLYLAVFSTFAVRFCIWLCLRTLQHLSASGCVFAMFF